ncbi:dephospho-CoA kinase [Vibrio sp. WJH972]
MGLIIGVTGGIASGKTTVANLFQQHFGIEIVDADIIARDVVSLNSEGLLRITEHFGNKVIQDDGTLDRVALRHIIFSQPKEKAWLDNLLHPMIRRRMVEALDETHSPYTLLVIPLLVENNLQSMADRILVIDVDEEIQITRTMQRDEIDREHAKRIVASQASRQQRLAVADDVIKNQFSNDELLQMVTKLHQKYLAMCDENL